MAGSSRGATAACNVPLLLALAGCLAAPGAAAAQEYAWRHFGAEAGLGSGNAVAFDGTGALVVATTDGIARFDGRTFQPIALPVEDAPVYKLEPAPDGTLWGLSEAGRLFRVDRDGFADTVPLPDALRATLQHDWVSRLRTDGRSRLWLAPSDTSLWRLDAGTGQWRRFAVPVPGERVRDFFLRGDTLVFATAERVGRVLFHAGVAGPVTWLFHGPAHGAERLRFIRPHPRHHAWVGTTGGVFLLRRDGTPRRVSRGRGEVWPYGEAAHDASGRLLVAAVEREVMELLRYGPEGEPELAAGPAQGLDLLPAGLAFHPEGGFWVASPRGLTFLEQEYLVAFPLLAPDGSVEYAHDLVGDPAGEAMWIATWGGLYRLDGNRVRRVSGPRRRAARAPAVAGDGTAWWEEHLGGGWTYRDGRRRGIGNRPVLVHEGRDGTRLWWSARALVRERGGRTVPLAERPATFWHPAEDADGRVWFIRDGTRLDVVWGDSLGSACRACLPPSLRAALTAVNRGPGLGRVAVDPAGRVWSHNPTRGLVVLRQRADGTWVTRRFGREDGLLSDHVVTIFPTADGRLWVATNRGLQAFAVPPGEPRLRPLLQLRARDGLPSEQVGPVREDEAGRVWLTVTGGRVHRLDWRRMERLPSPPVRLARLEVSGAPVRPGAQLRLRTADRLGVHLAPRTYRRAESVALQYRLAGRDTGWTSLAGSRSVVLSSLPAGRYALEARAARPGEAPGPVLRQELTVVPPFHQTPWFAALAATMVGLAGFGAHRVRLNRRLAAERLRLRIATDLHDDLGSGLTQVSLYAELIGRTAPGPASEWAGRIGEQARTLSGAMRDIVWALNPAEEGWEALELRMKDHALALLSPCDVALEMEGCADAAPASLPLDVRRHVLLFFKEVVHNAARHAGCSRVEVRWRLDRRALWLRICDDGCGFDPDAVRGGNGLRNLRARAAEIGAALRVETAPGRGTCVELDVPLR